MKKVKKFTLNVVAKGSIVTGVAVSLLFGLASPVSAQNYTFLPTYINQILQKVMGGGAGPQEYVNNRVKAALTILFIVVFIVAIAYSALAAVKFISSQGDSSKLEQSKAAVKAILMGFAAMLLAIIGLVIMLWLLGATNMPEENIPINQPA